MPRAPTSIPAALLAFVLSIPLLPLHAAPAFPVIHQVAGGAGEMFANAYIIEGRSGLLVVDSLLSRKASGSRPPGSTGRRSGRFPTSS